MPKPPFSFDTTPLPPEVQQFLDGLAPTVTGLVVQARPQIIAAAGNPFYKAAVVLLFPVILDEIPTGISLAAQLLAWQLQHMSGEQLVTLFASARAATPRMGAALNKAPDGG